MWGISVIHCPYCHGYEFRKKKNRYNGKWRKGFSFGISGEQSHGPGDQIKLNIVLPSPLKDPTCRKSSQQNVLPMLCLKK